MPWRSEILGDFSEEGLQTVFAGEYVTKALGPVPANFWLELGQHAASYPLEHLIDVVEGALLVGIANAIGRVRGRLKTANPELDACFNLRVPAKGRSIQYVIPGPPDDGRAFHALGAHYASVRDNHANEYFWVDDCWLSAEEYFARKEKR